ADHGTSPRARRAPGAALSRRPHAHYGVRAFAYVVTPPGRAALFARPLPYAFRASRIAGPACCPAALPAWRAPLGWPPVHTGKSPQVAVRCPPGAVAGRVRGEDPVL